MRKYLIWFLIGPIIVALGFWGWHYMRTRSLEEKSKTLAQNAPSPYLPPEVGQVTDQAVINRKALELAVKNFRASKTFRASISQPTAEGIVTGEVKYVKPLRLHAVLTPPDKKILEMIIIGGTVYVRTGAETWEMTNNAFAKTYGQAFFSSMLASDDTLASFGVADDAAISVKTDNIKKCKLYQMQYKQEDKDLSIQFCVNNVSQIISMITETKDGTVTANYKDFNAMFLIERPRMPLLQPTMPGASTSTNQ